MRGSSRGVSSSSTSLNRVLREIAADPVLFSRLILRFDPYPYQEKFLRDLSKRIIVCAGRQVGKSTVAAAKAVYFAATRSDSTTLIISATMRQSMLIFEKVSGFVDRSILRYSVAKKTRTRLVFENGGRIIALPCGRGDTLRGYTADLVILDEAAFMPEHVIANVVLPMIAAKNGYCWILSTPWDRGHIFYRIWIDESGAWTKYHWPSRLNPLISRDFLREQLDLIGEERFSVEYEARFLDEESSFFPMKLLRKVVEDYEPKLEPGAIYGYDPGGRESLAALVGVKYDSRRGKWYLTYWRAEKNASYSDFNALIRSLHEAASMERIVVDETGLGGPIVEELRGLGLPAVGVKLTERVKEEMFGRLKLMLEKGELALPNDPQLLSHLNCIQYERNRAGGFRFTRRAGAHDDLAYALALALYYQPSRGFLL